ncbi:aminoglycoside phosphotransferase family protein [Paratractidigestivibacter sp.]|uniref:phosphotransferase family protein n=1 Tax=Paratractidigestivibacter sp. TaxID=2847316 RepID=UPI002ABD6A3E|nr:aminoglycoside phosphotransferase family protein [Paratractidigestivibacter sp.]
MVISDNKTILVERAEKVVYQDGDRVVKSFKAAKPASDVLNEALNLARIAEAGVAAPKVLEVSPTADGGWALATEFVPGTTVRKLMDEAEGDKKAEILAKFVDLQVQVQNTQAPALLTSQRAKFKTMIAKVKDIDPSSRYELEMRAERMRGHKYICHGDFNPSNVILGEDGCAYVCDWAHVTRGLPEADAAMTYILFKMYHAELAEAYLDLYSEKADMPKQKIMYWVPVVAAAELARGRKDSEEMLKSFVEATNDYE